MIIFPTVTSSIEVPLSRYEGSIRIVECELNATLA